MNEFGKYLEFIGFHIDRGGLGMSLKNGKSKLIIKFSLINFCSN